jgi:hypothetical protein
MEDDLQKNENGRQPQFFFKQEWRPQILKKMEATSEEEKWKKTSKMKLNTNQSTKINLIGCDTIVNSPSLHIIRTFLTNNKHLFEN